MKILLKNGTIYDGTGAPSYMGDVYIEGERIVDIGTGLSPEVDKVIDCTGLSITPGFIDAHSHNDFFVDGEDRDAYFAPFIKQGITTQIVGNCGFSSYGVSRESVHKNKVGGGLFHTKKAGGFADFLHAARGRMPVNIAPLIGHGTVRIGISGYDAAHFSKAQIEEMLTHVREAMELGALGGSLGIMYQPGMYADKEEFVAFAREIAKYDGILTVHPRANSKVSLSYRPIFIKPHLEIALDEVINIAQEAGVKLHYSHLIHVGEATWKCCSTMLEKLHNANATYDLYAFCYGGSVITVILPPWYLHLSEEKRKRPMVQLRLKLLINLARKLLGLDFDDFIIADMGAKYAHYQGKNIGEIAREQGLSKIDMYIKLVEDSQGKARIFIEKYNNEEIILKLMQDKSSMFMTDAWLENSGRQSHATFQGFPLFLVKAREAGLPLAEIIHKMTGKTAERFRLPNRGTLKAGNFADITVFDYEAVSVDLSTPEATPKGINYVLINGNIVVDEGVYKPMLCGQMVLRDR
ncbi:MAG: amidohydrolase family protein [Defluviitaleaceae bacterium]|nr:amidohydrolase family protein [Defluviitaleaceae bacterium]MCL2274929.1 amidohydrolase family protein [Defluviitaleaceae bacterium]